MTLKFISSDDSESVECKRSLLRRNNGSVKSAKYQQMTQQVKELF